MTTIGALTPPASVRNRRKTSTVMCPPPARTRAPVAGPATVGRTWAAEGAAATVAMNNATHRAGAAMEDDSTSPTRRRGSTRETAVFDRLDMSTTRVVDQAQRPERSAVP